MNNIYWLLAHNPDKITTNGEHCAYMASIAECSKHPENWQNIDKLSSGKHHYSRLSILHIHSAKWPPNIDELTALVWELLCKEVIETMLQGTSLLWLPTTTPCSCQEHMLLRNQSGYGLSQWEPTLRCNVVSHWLSWYPKLSLLIYWIRFIYITTLCSTYVNTDHNNMHRGEMRRAINMVKPTLNIQYPPRNRPVKSALICRKMKSNCTQFRHANPTYRMQINIHATGVILLNDTRIIHK